MSKLKKKVKSSKKKTNKSKIPRKVSAELFLSTTPKAGNLNDHFGADS